MELNQQKQRINVNKCVIVSVITNNSKLTENLTAHSSPKSGIYTLFSEKKIQKYIKRMKNYTLAV